ncbi:secreted protein [Beggiatoa sp. PS]|nr:secreted protein [Beggiatoa sp. PS]
MQKRHISSKFYQFWLVTALLSLFSQPVAARLDVDYNQVIAPGGSHTGINFNSCQVITPGLCSPGNVQFGYSFFVVEPKNVRLVTFVTRQGGSVGHISVDYQVTNDYGTSEGSLIWADGDMNPKPIIISYPTETSLLTLTLSHVSNIYGTAIPGTPSNVSVTVLEFESDEHNVTLGMPDHTRVSIPKNFLSYSPTIKNEPDILKAPSILDYPDILSDDGILEIDIVNVLNSLHFFDSSFDGNYEVALKRTEKNSSVFGLTPLLVPIPNNVSGNPATFDVKKGILKLPRLMMHDGSCYEREMQFVPASFEFIMLENKTLVDCF